MSFQVCLVIMIFLLVENVVKPQIGSLSGKHRLEGERKVHA